MPSPEHDRGKRDEAATRRHVLGEEPEARQGEEAAPDALVVSLGVDTFGGDPISFFALESEDFLRMGGRLARLGIPTLFVMEGGYAVEEIGINTVNVLAGFEGG